MSRKYSAVPPPGYAQISNMDSRSNDGFAMPFPVSQKTLPAATASQTTRKRKSRFSDAPPSAAAPPPPTVLTELPVTSAKIANTGNSLESSFPQNDKSALISAAAAAAAKINASLKAQGKIKETAAIASLTSQSTASSSGASHYNPVEGAQVRRTDDMYSTEVEINDMPVGCRNYLTRLSTQESINKSCLAYVSTRGKYMTPDDKKLLIGISVSDKPLYLFIQSQSEANVKKALDRIRQIINNHFEKKSMYQSQALAQIASLSQRGQTSNLGSPPIPNTIAQAFEPGIPLIPTTTVSAMPSSQPALPCGNFVQEKLFIGLDSVSDSYDLKNKLLGPNYRNFNFISNQTGARVILRGKGSGFVEPTSGREAFESMYAFISHPSQSGVEAAKRLVQNLIDTIKREIPPNIVRTSRQGSNGNHYGYSGDFRSVPPPVPPPPTCSGPTVPSSGHMIAYPFQQFNQEEHQQTTSSSLNQNYSYGSSYECFQPNFSENGNEAVGQSKPTSTKSSKAKPRKRFTEDTDRDIPPTSIDEPAYQEKTVPVEAESRNVGSLPFWMAP